MVELVPGVWYGEWLDVTNWFAGGIEVFLTRKTTLLIFMGTKMLWAPDARRGRKTLAEWTIRLGILKEVVHVTGRGNTVDEALVVKMLLAGIEKSKVMLLIGAFHMNHTSILFWNVGIECLDFRTSCNSKLTLIDFLPSANGVGNEIAMKEMLGWVY